MANTWLNDDGLYVKFGTAQADLNNGGEYHNDGPHHVIEVKLDLTKVTVGNGSYIVSDTIFFPKNARIEQVDLFVETGATGSTATLNLGLIKSDRSTEIDFNGFAAAVAQSALATAGDKVRLNVGSTGAGALIGTKTTNSGYICADYDTAAFTAGVVIVRIYYYFD